MASAVNSLVQNFGTSQSRHRHHPRPKQSKSAQDNFTHLTTFGFKLAANQSMHACISSSSTVAHLLQAESPERSATPPLLGNPGQAHLSNMLHLVQRQSAEGTEPLQQQTGTELGRQDPSKKALQQQVALQRADIDRLENELAALHMRLG